MYPDTKHKNNVETLSSIVYNSAGGINSYRSRYNVTSHNDNVTGHVSKGISCLHYVSSAFSNTAIRAVIDAAADTRTSSCASSYNHYKQTEVDRIGCKNDVLTVESLTTNRHVLALN